MEKRWMRIGALLVCCALALTGCGGRSAPPEPTPAAGNGGLEDGKAFDRDILSEMYGEEGALTVEYEGGSYELEYVYHVPQLDEDTEGASEINALLHQLFDWVGALDAPETADMVERYQEVGYESYWSGSILSLVVVADTYEISEYNVFLYDAATGCQVTQEELREMHRISREELVTLARISAVEVCDQICLPGLECVEEEDLEGRAGVYADLLSCRLTTVRENLGAELPLFLNDEGELMVIAALGVSGGGIAHTAVPLVRDASRWEEMKYVDVPGELMGTDLNRWLLELGREESYAWQTEDGGSCVISLDDADPAIFRCQTFGPDEEPRSCTGSLTPLGVDEAGYLYAYTLTACDDGPMPEDAPHSGKFYARPDWAYSPGTESYEVALFCRWCEGDDLLGAGEAETCLVRAYG